MAYSDNTVLLQVIATLGLNVRDTAGVPTYSTSLGDSTYSPSELNRGVSSAGSQIMQAICETEGHPLRGPFVSEITLTHETPLVLHYGPTSVPKITPYSGAAYTLRGKRKSIEEIASYRANVNDRYSATAHNAQDATTGSHSKLAGFYAFDNDTPHFTGFSAVADIATFVESDTTKLPEGLHWLGIALAIANLKKDGDISDIFTSNERMGVAGLVNLKSGKMDQPSLTKTIGSTRDGGAK
jgi:hypothetical protein